MKLDSPKRKAAKAAIKAQMWNEWRPKLVPSPAKKPKRESWWVPFGSDASLPREDFYETAHAYDEARRTDPTWKQPDKLQQIGQL